MRPCAGAVVLLVIVDAAVTLIPNATVADVNNTLKDTRRARFKDRSTSSSSGEKKNSDDYSNDLSLDVSESTSYEDKNKYKEMPNNVFKGWRKWHRVCSPCPEEMNMKWRDPSIEWICGGYQRARRSFKSTCMMYYRNCQDGTMFVKLHDHRCNNDTLHGDHFFYDYKAPLSIESDTTSESSESQVSSVSFYSDE